MTPRTIIRNGLQALVASLLATSIGCVAAVCSSRESGGGHVQHKITITKHVDQGLADDGEKPAGIQGKS